MAVDHSKKNIYKRIESLFSCANGEELFASMVTMQLELAPELNSQTAESFVIFGIIKEFDDRELDRLWYFYLTQSFSKRTAAAA
jgi:hypothetical protein